MSLDSSLQVQSDSPEPHLPVPGYAPWDAVSWVCLSSYGHSQLHAASRRHPVLHVTAQAMNSGYRVMVNSAERCVRPAQFDYLLELLIAAYSAPECPDLYVRETVCTDGDADRTRHAVQRLRKEMADGSVIANNKRGGYRLTIPPTQIALCDTLWRLPAQLISQTTLHELRKKHEAYWGTQTRNLRGELMLR